MRNLLSLAAAGAALALVAGATSASATTFAGTYQVAGYFSGSNGGLDINIDDGSGGFQVNNLVIGSSQTINDLFRISAGENISVPGGGNDGDGIQQSIHVNFTFTAPVNFPGSGPDDVINGFTVGVDGNPDHGHVTWTTSPTVDFGSFGVLTIKLQDVNFSHTGDADDGTHVGATFSLAAPKASPTAGVPEPASWALMITGFGMAGATLRRRRAAVAA